MTRPQSAPESWLAYSPMLYKHLSLAPSPGLDSISSVRWLRNITDVKRMAKTEFKMEEGYFCVAGGRDKGFVREGLLAVYKYSFPVQDSVDDDRLTPVVTLRTQWAAKEEIQLIEQYATDSEDKDMNNMFAIAYKKHPHIDLFSTRKLLAEGGHEYLDNFCQKLQGHTAPINSIKWANLVNFKNKLYSASEDATIMQWNLDKMVAERHMRYHKKAVKDITPIYDWSPQWGRGPNCDNPHNTLASVSSDGCIFIWDDRQYAPVLKIGKQRELTAVQCVSKHQLLTGSVDGGVKFWDIRKNKEYSYDTKLDRAHGHHGPVRRIQVRRGGPSDQRDKNQKIRFSTCGDDGKILEWQQKIQFIHEGHESLASFDIWESNNLTISAQKGKNMFMIWESGVSFGHFECT